MTPLLECHRASFQVGRKHLVKDVSFALERGEVLAIAGANGAGKSTLLRLLAGDLRPSSGSVTVESVQAEYSMAFASSIEWMPSTAGESNVAPLRMASEKF